MQFKQGLAVYLLHKPQGCLTRRLLTALSQDELLVGHSFVLDLASSRGLAL